MLNKLRGQSLSEYSLCLAIILIAILGINIYVKRGLQGRYKDVVKDMTNAASAKAQYEPYYVDVNSTVNRSLTVEKTGKETVTTSISAEPATMSSKSTESTGKVGTELEEGSTITEVK